MMRNAIVRKLAWVSLLFGTVLTAQVTAQPADTAKKKLYCWDEGGRKVCGDALPASAAAAARTEISATSGRTLDTVARALTPEERVAADAAARQARLAADQRLSEQRRDLAMVESYATEADLRGAYAERADLLDTSIKASILGERNLHQSLLSLLSHAADDELAGTTVTRLRQMAIAEQHAELLKQQRILEQQRDDRAALDIELADSVQRYRTMKQGQEPAAPPATPPAGTP